MRAYCPVEAPEGVLMDTGETLVPLVSFRMPEEPRVDWHIVADDETYALAVDRDADGRFSRVHRWPHAAARALADLVAADPA